MQLSTADSDNLWPRLPALDEWRDTFETLHRWTQIVGKVRLESGPWINHSWGTALYVTTRGLTTSPMPCDGRTFAVDFDFIEHELRLSTSTGERRGFDLEPMPVAEFYRRLMDELSEAGIEVEINQFPVEIPDPIVRFSEDEQHASYDRGAVELFWQALVQADRVLTEFRSRFSGKVSPVHFFWGAFDLAVTRFSGRDAPPHPGGVPNCPDWVMEEAYSRELSSAGFWPGEGVGEAAFYSYAYPEPEGFAGADVEPGEAYYHDELGEFVLPYAAVSSSDDPDRSLMRFLQSTYEPAAELADWDRDRLEQGFDPETF